MKILVRMSNWLGDVVLGTPALARLAELFPGSEIVVLAPPGIRDILLHHPAITRFLDASIGDGTLAPFQLGNRLRREHFDKAYLFPNSFSSALSAWWANIPERVGYAHDGRSVLLTDARPRDAQALSLHMVHYYLHLVEPDGTWGPEYRPSIHLTAGEQHWAEDYLQAHGEPVVGINPGAVGGTAKRWLPERFAQLAARLVKARGARVVLFGNRTERLLTQEIARMAAVPVINTAGETNLRQLAALMARCRWIVSNDTGGMHVADAVGARVLAIIGSTIHKNTRPFGDKNIIVREDVDCSPYAQPCMRKECPIDHRCMTAITVERVWEAMGEKDLWDVWDL